MAVVITHTAGPDGRILATVTESGLIYLWNVIARKQIGHALTGGGGLGSSAAFSPDSKT